MMDRARIAGLFYVLTFVGGLSAMWLRGTPGVAALLVSAGAYVVVTLLFYGLFKPVNASLSAIAALVSVTGCVVGALRALHVAPVQMDALVVFGVYCLLVGYLIFRSTYLPRAVGVLMAIGGLGWLTFASRTLVHALYPWNLAPGMIGEGVLTVWLVAFGVDPARFVARARQSGAAI